MNIESAGLLVGRILALLCLVALLGEALARAGAGLLLFVHRRRTRALERFGLGLLLGFSVLGFAYFGLALAGLFLPFVLAGTALALIGSSLAVWPRSSLVAAAIQESRTAGILGLSALTIGLAVMAGKLLLPESHPDSWAYHLGVAWQYLQAGRAVYEHVPVAFHVPLPVEMAFALPLIVGDDRLAKIFVFLCFIASCAVFAARCFRIGYPNAAWLGPLLLVSSGAVPGLATMCKSDGPAAALFVAGAMLQLGGAWAPGALMLGLCVTAKLVYGPVVALWALCFLPPWRRLGWWVVLLLLPLIPWMLKTYLVTGNPIYPFASEWFPSLNWSPANWQVRRRIVGIELESQALRDVALPMAWFTVMKGYLPVLLALPGLLLLSRHRRAAGACVGAQLLLLMISNKMRYVMPTFWLLTLLMAEEIRGLPGRLKGAAVWALGMYALAGVLLLALHWPDWRKTWTPWSQLKPRLTTYLAVEPWLTRSGRAAVSWKPRAPRARRVVTVGELRTYYFPFRVIFNGAWGATPVVWKMVHESRDGVELRKKFKQLGAKRLMLNYVSVDFSSLWYGPFSWKHEDLRRYVEFCKQQLVRLGRSEQSDFANGGFCVYEILRDPLPAPPAEIWFAPGTEAVYGPGLRFATTSRTQAALKEYLLVAGLLADVGYAWNRVGHAYLQLNDFPNALRYLQKFGARGMLDSSNMSDWGIAALGAGKLALAKQVLADALQRYPDRRYPIMINQASCHVQKALQVLAQQRVGEAERYVKRGLTMLEAVPEDLDRESAAGRRTTLASLFGVQGEVYLVQKKPDLAAEWFAKAVQVGPEMPMAARWLALASRPGPQVFRGSPEP